MRLAPNMFAGEATRIDPLHASALMTCSEAAHLLTSYNRALADYQKAQDRLAAGWSNAVRRQAADASYNALLSARRRLSEHLEQHGCGSLKANSYE